MTSDEAMERHFLRRAIELARSQSALGAGGPFGALLVRDGTVLATGWNQVTSANDPTAHAEVVAIREACRTAGEFHLTGAVLYTSCEPCPMCLGAAYWARVSRIVYGAARTEAAEIGFDDAFIYEELKLDADQRRLPMSSILSVEAAEMMREWAIRPGRVLY